MVRICRAQGTFIVSLQELDSLPGVAAADEQAAGIRSGYARHRFPADEVLINRSDNKEAGCEKKR